MPKRHGIYDAHILDIAASAQKVTEEILVLLAKEAAGITGSKNLCMAGGVALNCVANGKILKENIFDNIWIQPAGRKDSRNLIFKFNFDCISSLLGSAMILLFPSARGPYSIRP